MQKELGALTFLRFFAAFFVFLFHMEIRWPAGIGQQYSAIVSQGAIGMTIFFMLSGFVLAYRYQEQNFDMKRYAIHRFAKIYPVYLLAMVLTLPWLVAQVGELPGGIVVQVVAVIFLVLASLTLVQAWFTPLFSVWNFGASWSISVEAFLYGIFPALARRLASLTPRAAILVGATTYLVACSPGLVIMIFSGNSGPIAQFYSMPIFRLAEFMLGIMAFRLAKVIQRGVGLVSILTALGWIALLAYLVKFGAVFPAVYVTHGWLVIPVVFLTLITLNSNRALSQILGIAPLRILGHASYSFYTIQIVFILVLIDVHPWLVNSFPVLANNVVLTCVTFVALTISSIALYWLFEEPVRRRIILKMTK
jgi:peptidoglycan/LPS O-acetylase OafA/YrhL